MPITGLQTALSEIRQACEEQPSLGGGLPYFFVVGAGISYPSVPLAREIEEECRSIAAKNKRYDAPRTDSALDRYSHWFAKAYPHPRLRQNYLRKIMQDRPLTDANLRLAHILTSGRVAKLVVTPNFDDLLQRALGLFGAHHIVCDHPATVSRIDPAADDVQIVHVHGTYWFYDCCNLRAELEARASQDSILSMGTLLNRALSSKSPLVIGYSGWDGDVIAEAIHRRLETGLGFKGYWFCYRKEDLDAIPRAIREHEHMCFVVPEHETASKENEAQDDTTEAVNEPAVLTARHVFDSLIQEFQLPSPELTNNPIKFFASHLRALVPPSDLEGEGFYFFRSVIERVEAAQSRDVEIRLAGRMLENIRDCVRQSRYNDAVTEAQNLPPGDLDIRQTNVLIEILSSAVQGIADDNDISLQAYEEMIRFAEYGRKKTNDEKERSRLDHRLAIARLERGSLLFDKGGYADVIADVDAGLALLRENDRPSMKETVAKALLRRGMALRQVGEPQKAIDQFRALVKDLNNGSTETLPWAARALVALGDAIRDVHGVEQALVYFKKIERFANRTEPELLTAMAQGALRRATLLEDPKFNNSRFDELLSAYDAATNYYNRAGRLGLADLCQTKKAEALGLRERWPEALAALEGVAGRGGQDEKHRFCGELCQAQLLRSELLERAGRRSQALMIVQSMIDDCDSTNADVSRIKCRYRALLLKGRILVADHRVADALAIFRQVASESDPHKSIRKIVEEAQSTIREIEAKPSA